MEIAHAYAEVKPEDRIGLEPYLPTNTDQFIDDLIRHKQWDYDRVKGSRGEEIAWSEERANKLFEQYLQGKRVFYRATYKTETGGKFQQIETGINIVTGNIYIIAGGKALHLVQKGKEDDASVSGKREAVAVEKDDPESVDNVLKAAIQKEAKLDPDKYLIGKDLLQEFTEDWSRGFPIWTHTEARGRDVLITKATPDEFNKDVYDWEKVSALALPKEFRQYLPKQVAVEAKL
jgi:hypothetical protein